MKSIFNKIMIVIITLIICVSTSIYFVKASDNSSSTVVTNLEDTSSDECRNLMFKIIRCSYGAYDLSQFDYLFTDQAYSAYGVICQNGYIDKPSAVSNLAIDFTYPENSSTGDTVIMANAKMNYSGYKLLYLYEFHVNSDGKIYGVNVWEY